MVITSMANGLANPTVRLHYRLNGLLLMYVEMLNSFQPSTDKNLSGRLSC